MQYASTNWLNFIGFQVGEAVLYEAGYYEPERVLAADYSRLYDRYYVFTDHVWADDEYQFLFQWTDDSDPFYVAKANSFERGRFSGKHGIETLADLKSETAQNFVIRDVFVNNWKTMLKYFQNYGQTLESILGKEVVWHNGDDEGIVKLTASGLLAAAHISGATAAAQLAVFNIPTVDENGVSNAYYAYLFGGAEVNVPYPAEEPIPIYAYGGNEYFELDTYPAVLHLKNGGNKVYAGFGSETGAPIYQQIIDFDPTEDTLFTPAKYGNPLIVVQTDSPTAVVRLQDTDHRIHMEISITVKSGSDVNTISNAIYTYNDYEVLWYGEDLIIDDFRAGRDRFISNTSHKFSLMLLDGCDPENYALRVLDSNGKSAFRIILNGFPRNVTNMTALHDTIFLGFLGHPAISFWTSVYYLEGHKPVADIDSNWLPVTDQVWDLTKGSRFDFAEPYGSDSNSPCNIEEVAYVYSDTQSYFYSNINEYKDDATILFPDSVNFNDVKALLPIFGYASGSVYNLQWQPTPPSDAPVALIEERRQQRKA